MPQILAFDLGGSSLKLALVDESGQFQATVRKSLAILNVNGTHFDVDPMLWWNAFIECCEELAGSGHDLSQVTSIAGCGFTRTQVFLDATGKIVRPAIPFQDSRAAILLEDLRSNSPELVRNVIGELTPFDPLARLLWLQHEEPAHWAEIHRIIEPKDFLNLMLTGAAVSDTISQTPMTRRLTQTPDAVLEALGMDRVVLPDLLSPYTVIARARTDLPEPLAALSGVPVYCGSLDTWCCVLGSGGMVPDVGYAISGTSDVSGLIASQPLKAAGLLTVAWGEDIWQLGGPSQGAGTRLQWALERFFPDCPSETALETALQSTGNAPLFLPFLDGERTPWWDADLRGAFLGLATAHTANVLVRAVAEGMNYLAKDVLARAEQALGQPVKHVCFSGGLARNPALCQLKADVLDRLVFVPDDAETGLAGAASLAGSSGRQMTAERISGRFYHPSPAARQRHDDRFAIFQDASAVTRDISHRLSRIENQHS